MDAIDADICAFRLSLFIKVVVTGKEKCIETKERRNYIS